MILYKRIKRTTCLGLMTRVEQCLLVTLFNIVDNIVQHCYTWLQVIQAANIGTKMALLNVIFINPEQIMRFYACM